jgi:SAM-dependent methyltransferase
MAQQHANWRSGDSYERYMGRWSRLVANDYIQWLNQPAHAHWLDVGCGTGALTEHILRKANPQSIVGVDMSVDFANHAQSTLADARFLACNAQNLPFNDDTFDAVVSGLALNFVPQPQQAVNEMQRVTKAGGVVSVYVWDYAGKMEFLRYFWDTAIVLDPSSKTFDQAERFPICQPEPLREVFQNAGLQNVEVQPIEINTVFQDFEDYWLPFTLGNFPAPRYVVALPEDHQAQLRKMLLDKLPIDSDGKIRLQARVWAVRGTM